MIVTSLLLLVPLAMQPAPGAGCTEYHQCRELALAAADRGDFELFHDLAWRAVQTGPKQDASLMLLLARAQALSGRPHDALGMLQRLAGMGVATDAATNPDFSRTRELPGWPEVAERIARVNPNGPAVATPASGARRPTPAAASSAAAAAPLPPSTAAAATPASTPEAVRFSATGFVLGGL